MPAETVAPPQASGPKFQGVVMAPYSVLLRLGFPRAKHLDRGITHTLVDVHHIHNELLAPTLRHEEAGVMAGLPQGVVAWG